MSATKIGPALRTPSTPDVIASPIMTENKLGPALRVTPQKPIETSPATENKRESIMKRSTPKTHSSSVKAPRLKSAVQRAQEQALAAFGGLSLGNVLQDAPLNTAGLSDAKSPEMSASRPLTRLERAQLEADKAFEGADFAQLTNAVKQRLQDASEKHLENADEQTQTVIRKKLDLAREEANAIWGGADLGEVDFKLGLSRVEVEQIELVKQMSEDQLLELQAREVVHQECIEQEELARQQRDEERRLRFEKQKAEEAEREARFESDRIDRRQAKVAPFMQSETIVEEEKNVEETTTEQEEDSVESEPATPERTFKTAMSSLVGTPVMESEQANFLDESMGELLSRISMSNLSAELTPVCAEELAQEEEIEELMYSLQKHRTPLQRTPHHDAAAIDEPLREALEEMSQHNEAREEVMEATMRETLNGYTVKQLKDELKERELKVSGLKAELIDRLMGYHQEHKDEGSNGQCQIM